MRDQHHRLAGRCLLQTALELGFALVIQVAAGLIKQQHGRVIDQGTSHGNGLALTTRQRLTALAHQHVIALGVIGHKFIHPGNAGGAQHIRLTSERSPHQQVLLQAAVEQHGVLRYMTNGTTQIHRVNLACIYAINQHSTFRGLIQAQHQLFQRCLARANAANNANALAGLHCKAHAREAALLTARVAEADIAKLDGTAQIRPRDKLAAGLVLHRHLHIVVDGAERGASIVVLHHQPRHLAKRRKAAPRDHGCRNDAAHGNRCILHLIDANDDHRHRHQLLQGLHKVHRARGDELDLAPHIGDVLRGAFPQALHTALGIERFYRFKIGERLDQQGIALR